ncbi:RHS repeat-associated core domain-containing protein [Dehalobacterium formicoaceticum]|uniref:RHS repeat-associated core domain-containing protein n=1 Tax=Dehalobacterium formicoaceticum TaxID=51515 RepID=UPI0018DFFE24|nr:RHS repeat-associated core domain-containing protein [Dehalobacterium formicoaceticum]
MQQVNEEESWFNSLVGPSIANNVHNNKYAAWDDTSEIVSPQTGELTLRFDDIQLPGRNGLDLTIGRIYQSSQARTGKWDISPFEDQQNSFSSYFQERYNLGTGWSFAFPSVQVEQDSDQDIESRELYYHTGNGEVYLVKMTSQTGDSNLENYYRKDCEFRGDTTYVYMDGTEGDGLESIRSQYVFETADKTKQYFAADGRLMAIIDRFGNKIEFKHKLFPVTNRVVNYDFDDSNQMDSGVPWTFNEAYLKIATDKGYQDNTSLWFEHPSSTRTTQSAFSKPIKVTPNRKHRISGYLADALDAGVASVRIHQYSKWRGIHYNAYLGGWVSGYFLEKVPNSSIEIASSSYGDWNWRGFEEYFTVDDDTDYIQIEFLAKSAKGDAWLDKVCLDQVYPLITEITDSIGRKINFQYTDNFYEEDGEDDNNNPITVTIKDPSLSQTKTLTYQRGVINTQSYDYLFQGVLLSYKNGELDMDDYQVYPGEDYSGQRRYPSLGSYHDGEDLYEYKYSLKMNLFSFVNKKSSGGYATIGEVLLSHISLRNSRINYNFYETKPKHLGKRGFYEQSYLTDREEDYRVNNKWDRGEHNKRTYSYGGTYQGNPYDNETGYSETFYSNHDLPKNTGFQWICSVEQEDGLKTDYVFKGSSAMGLREDRRVTYHSGGEKETLYYEEYDGTYHNQPLRIKSVQENSGGTYPLYQGYTYNTWGGVAKETKPLTPAQWEDSTQKELNTVSYTYHPTYKFPASTSYYQKEGVLLTENTEYTSSGAIQSTTNAKGETTYFEYADGAHPGNCSKTWRALPNGQQEITEYQYDANYAAYPTRIMQKYTEDGVPKTSITTRQYDFLWGHLISEDDALGNETTYQYDTQGRLMSEWSPWDLEDKSGTYIAIRYFTYDKVLLTDYGYNGRGAFRVQTSTIHFRSIIDRPIINRTYDYYDDYGNLLVKEEWEHVQGLTRATQFHYGDYGRLVSSKDPLQRETVYSIDEWDRLKSVTDVQGNKQFYEYDIVQQSKDTYFQPAGGSSENHYRECFDERGRIIERRAYPVSGGPGVSESYTYDLLDNLIRLTDGKENQTDFHYDALGNVSSVTNALGENTDYAYNHLNQISEIKQYENSQSIINSKAYDERGALLSQTRPMGETRTYVNNAVGLPVLMTDATGKSTAYSYDYLNRLKEKRANEDGITLTYHPMGQPDQYAVWKDTGGSKVYGDALTYEYFGDGVTRERMLGNYSTAFQYDPVLNRTSVQDPFNLTVQYSYDSLNHPDQVTVEGQVFDYEFYGDGMLKSVQYPAVGGKIPLSTYTYDNMNRLTFLVNKVGTQIISQYSYRYDDNSNIIEQVENGSVTRYTYDVLNRLIETTLPDGTKKTYGYDTRGNRTQMRGTAEDELTGIPGTFTYNNWDQLDEFSSQGEVTQYQYDGEGLRTAKTNDGDTLRYHLDDQGRVLAESNGAGQVTAQNIWGHRMLARKISGSYYYYFYNGHGDVVQIVNSSGTVVNRYTYDEWGNVLSQTEGIDNPILYAGEYYDEESGLYYLRARYYDPSVGRFISEDPARHGLNWYTYCFNNPVNFIDPSGLAYVQLRPTIQNLGGSISWNSNTNVGTVYLDGSSVTVYDRDGNGNFIQGGLMYSNDTWLFAALAVKFDLGNGWTGRIERDASGARSDKHAHVYKGDSKYAQNEDGSPHDGSKGGPPGSVKNNLKKKKGWDWDAKEKDWANKIYIGVDDGGTHYIKYPNGRAVKVAPYRPMGYTAPYWPNRNELIEYYTGPTYINNNAGNSNNGKGMIVPMPNSMPIPMPSPAPMPIPIF